MPKKIANPDPVVVAGFGEVRLGKAPPKKDSRNLLFARYAASAAKFPRVKGKVSRTPAVLARNGFPMYENHRLGDCTCVTMGHLEIGISETSGRPQLPSVQAILDAYWATGSLDDGRYCLDILNYWRNTGLAGEKIYAFAQVKPKNRLHVRLAMELFGGLYLGIALPESAQRQRVWSLKRNEGSSEPWSWGGHAVGAFDYDRSGVTIATWGSTQRMTWGFFEKYVDEAYVPIHPDWFDAGGKSPAGFNLEKLQADLVALTGG